MAITSAITAHWPNTSRIVLTLSVTDGLLTAGTCPCGHIASADAWADAGTTVGAAWDADGRITSWTHPARSAVTLVWVAAILMTHQPMIRFECAMIDSHRGRSRGDRRRLMGVREGREQRNHLKHSLNLSSPLNMHKCLMEREMK